jgi:membrane-associated phospholipid phosphatase
MNRPMTVLSVLCVALTLGTDVVCAKSPSDYAVDLKDYVLAPIHWDSRDWRWAGGAVIASAAAYSLDHQVRDHFADAGARTSADPNRTRDATPIAVLLAGGFALGELGRNPSRAHLGMDMAESAALSLLSSTALKIIAGRERPFETASHERFRRGGDGFPSAHTAAAFAAAQVFAERMPREQWGWRLLAYGLAGATAYARLDSNVHWFSDTVAGAALGIATGRFVSGRGQNERPRVSYWVAPMDHGARVSFNVNMD